MLPALSPLLAPALIFVGLVGNLAWADDVPMTAKEADAIRQQVIPNWAIDFEHPCKRKVDIRVHLAPDGTVRQAEGLDDFAGDDACRAAQESAIRAVQVSSPLRMPAGRSWQTIVLMFDPSLLQ